MQRGQFIAKNRWYRGADSVLVAGMESAFLVVKKKRRGVRIA
ncbi:hypothetical protein [Oceanobacillus alkalisoli]|nr:hypothetical protein [Oceanobacillus alkalisoli]